MFAGACANVAKDTADCGQFNADAALPRWQPQSRAASFRIPTMIPCCWSLRLLLVVTAWLIAGSVLQTGHAHGSVTPDADMCIIRIGYFRAHFKVYLPETRGHEQFCEDLPGIGDSVFVMEYEHDGLASVPIDFRIIRNVTGKGRFTSVDDIAAIADLDAVTVFHQPAAVQRDVFTIAHRFAQPGEYVGIITLSRPDGGGEYRAVFPFEAGPTGFGYWPWVIAAVVLLQVNYLWMSGRLRARRKHVVAPVRPLPEHRHG